MGYDETRQIEILNNEKIEINEEIEKLNEQCIERPDPPEYLELSFEMTQFLKMQCKTDRIISLMTDDSQLENWIETAYAFLNNLNKSYPLYMDIVQPFCLGLLEMCHGYATLLFEGRRKSRENVKIQELITKMTKMPNLTFKDLNLNNITFLIENNEIDEIGILLSNALVMKEGVCIGEQERRQIVYKMQLSILNSALKDMLQKSISIKVFISFHFISSCC